MRAYTNLSAEGSEIALFENEEIEELYREMLAYDDRVAPGRAYVPWHMAGQAKLWVANGRWDDAEHQLRSLSGLEGANQYLRLKIATVLSLLETYRGQHHDAAQRLRPLVEDALRIGDLQAYGPVLTALVHAEALLGNGEVAADAAALVIERRGDAPEADITSWSLFNMTDAVDWLLANAPDAAAERMLGDLLALSRTAAADVVRGGTPPQVRARRALFGAASEQLRACATRAGVDTPASVPHEALPDRARAIDDLHAAHRPFEAARVELWLAEEASASGEGRAQRAASARALFAELGAVPYLHRIGGLTQAE